jgi:hypothetical protein
MRLKRLLKFLDDSDRVLGKLEKVTIKVCLLAHLAYTLYKIAIHR